MPPRSAPKHSPPHSPRPIRHNSVGVVRVCFPHRRQHYFGFHSAPCRPAISTAKQKTHDKCTCNKWRRGNAKTRFVYYVGLQATAKKHRPDRTQRKRFHENGTHKPVAAGEGNKRAARADRSALGVHDCSRAFKLTPHHAKQRGLDKGGHPICHRKKRWKR